jgi:hypothetical protein
MPFTKTATFLPAAALLLASAASLPAQKCKDIPLTFTFQETALLSNLDGTVSSAAPAASAFVGDGNDVYVDGPGVDTTIRFCSGTHDAVLNLLVSKRKLTAKLPAPIPGSGTNSNTPPSATYSGNGVFNVRNIICYGCLSPGQPFVTHIYMGLNAMFNKDDYGIRFLPASNPTSLPLAANLDNDASDVAILNSPNSTSLAVVLPQPYNCSQGVYPSWVVRGTLPNDNSGAGYLQVGSLYDKTKSVTAGQFSMPFELRIRANQCFNPGY